MWGTGRHLATEGLSTLREVCVYMYILHIFHNSYICTIHQKCYLNKWLCSVPALSCRRPHSRPPLYCRAGNVDAKTWIWPALQPLLKHGEPQTALFILKPFIKQTTEENPVLFCFFFSLPITSSRLSWDSILWVITALVVGDAAVQAWKLWPSIQFHKMEKSLESLPDTLHLQKGQGHPHFLPLFIHIMIKQLDPAPILFLFIWFLNI